VKLVLQVYKDRREIKVPWASQDIQVHQDRREQQVQLVREDVMVQRVIQAFQGHQETEDQEDKGVPVVLVASLGYEVLLVQKENLGHKDQLALLETRVFRAHKAHLA